MLILSNHIYKNDFIMDSSKENKVLYFEYVIFKLSEWIKEIYPQLSHPEYTFGKLKALKMLFFVAAVDATEENHKLLSIFDNFYAMSYGPVESDLYNSILHKCTKYYDIQDRITLHKNNGGIDIFNSIPIDIKKAIDENIELLKSKNHIIVDLPPYKLVDISHKWPVWVNSMNIANVLGKRSEPMPTEKIIKSKKYYD